jgi:hypothetical protein
VDAIHFEHWNQAYSNQSALGNYALQYIHEKNMLVGGNIYGGSVPDLTDYVGLTTQSFQIQMPSNLYYPAIGLMTNSNPLDASSEACAFMNQTNFVQAGNFDRVQSVSERISILQNFLDDPNAPNYSMAWPVFAPMCPSQNAYDATADGVYDWIRSNALNEDVVNTAYKIPVAVFYNASRIPRNISTGNPQGSRASEKNVSFHSVWLLVVVLLTCL